MIRIYFLIIYGLSSISCTSNIFWEDLNKNELNISGFVKAENNKKLVPTLVYLQELDQYTFTDPSGYFSIPISGTQSNNGNLSGKTTIYFFVHNYKLDSLAINFTNGELSKDQLNLSEEGELLDTVSLKKLFSGEMELHFGANHLKNRDTLSATFHMSTFMDFSLNTFKYIVAQSNFHSGLIFSSTNSSHTFIYRFSDINEAGESLFDQLNTIRYNKNFNITWDYIIFNDQISLEEGIYEVFPYFIINNNKKVLSLIERVFSDSALFISNKYLEIPCDIIPDTLVIN